MHLDWQVINKTILPALEAQQEVNCCAGKLFMLLETQARASWYHSSACQDAKKVLDRVCQELQKYSNLPIANEQEVVSL